MSKPTEDRGLEQLREILVGGIQRDLERRVTRAESHSSIRATELQQDAKQRIEMIEAHIRAELDALASRTTTLEQRTASLEGTLARMQQEVRDQILQQAKVFLDELQKVRAELVAMLDHELHAFEESLGEDEPRGESRGDESATH
jgi:hypothetical protein